MKVLKRNAVILTVLVFVCAAIYLNWSYGQKTADPVGPASTPGPTQQTGGGLYYEPDGEAGDYFSVVRLSRRQARDTAMATLSSAIETASVSDAVKQNTLSEISEITETALTETELEGLIKAKGFSECVVFLDGDGMVVAVAAPETGLEKASVAQIADVIQRKTSLTLEKIRIIEVR